MVSYTSVCVCLCVCVLVWLDIMKTSLSYKPLQWGHFCQTSPSDTPLKGCLKVRIMFRWRSLTGVQCSVITKTEVQTRSSVVKSYVSVCFLNVTNPYEACYILMSPFHLFFSMSRKRCVWSFLQEGFGQASAGWQECFCWCWEVHALQAQTWWISRPTSYILS